MLYNAFLAFLGTSTYPKALKALISQNKTNSGKAAKDIIFNAVKVYVWGTKSRGEMRMRFYISGVSSDDDLRCFDQLKGNLVNKIRINRLHRMEVGNLVDKINEDLDKI